MKKPGVIVLLILCFTFIAFLGGFYLGRNLNDAPIRISSLTTPTDPNDSAAEDPTPTGDAVTALININTATKEQLESLPGIGPTIAQRILDYIQENGPFETMSQLTVIKGIDVIKLNAILDLATVGG